MIKQNNLLVEQMKRRKQPALLQSVEILPKEMQKPIVKMPEPVVHQRKVRTVQLFMNDSGEFTANLEIVVTHYEDGFVTPRRAEDLRDMGYCEIHWTKIQLSLTEVLNIVFKWITGAIIHNTHPPTTYKIVRKE